MASEACFHLGLWGKGQNLPRSSDKGDTYLKIQEGRTLQSEQVPTAIIAGSGCEVLMLLSLSALWLGSKTPGTRATRVPGISPQFPPSVSGVWAEEALRRTGLCSHSPSVLLLLRVKV